MVQAIKVGSKRIEPMDYTSVNARRRVFKGDLRAGLDCDEVALVTQVVGRATEIARRILNKLSTLG
jgi:hypothetical protein